jgi:hypothetical protein
MLWDNVDRRISAAARLLAHAEIAGVGNTAKSSYYRSAIILLCTVVEGMVYELVKKHTTPPNHIFNTNTKYIEKYKIPLGVLGNTDPLFIFVKKEENVSINDKGADFGKYIMYLKNHNIVTKTEYQNLNWSRLERNKIHVQGLTTPDTGYTKAKIEKIGKIISFLEKKII